MIATCHRAVQENAEDLEQQIRDVMAAKSARGNYQRQAAAEAQAVQDRLDAETATFYSKVLMPGIRKVEALLPKIAPGYAIRYDIREASHGYVQIVKEGYRSRDVSELMLEIVVGEKQYQRGQLMISTKSDRKAIKDLTGDLGDFTPDSIAKGIVGAWKPVAHAI